MTVSPDRYGINPSAVDSLQSSLSFLRLETEPVTNLDSVFILNLTNMQEIELFILGLKETVTFIFVISN